MLEWQLECSLFSCHFYHYDSSACFLFEFFFDSVQFIIPLVYMIFEWFLSFIEYTYGSYV